MDASLASLRASFGTHAAWNALMTLPCWLLLFGGCPITGALADAASPMGVTPDPMDGRTARAMLLATAALGVVGISMLVTLHRAVAIAIAREPAGATVRSALTQVARHAGGLAALGALRGALDVITLALASAIGIATNAPGVGTLFALGAWLLARPALGLGTAAMIDRGQGALGALASGQRALHGRRALPFLVRGLSAVVAGGALALVVGVPFFGLMGLVVRGAAGGPAFLLALLYVLVLPWIVMHLATLDALLEWKTYERTVERLDATRLARTFE